MDTLEDLDRARRDISGAFDCAAAHDPAWEGAKLRALALFDRLLAERHYLRGTVVRQEQRIIDLMENANAG